MSTLKNKDKYDPSYMKDYILIISALRVKRKKVISWAGNERKMLNAITQIMNDNGFEAEELELKEIK